MRRPPTHHPIHHDLMVKLGLVPLDTDFNRRAAAYSRAAEVCASSNAYAARQREAKNDRLRPEIPALAAIDGETNGR